MSDPKMARLQLPKPVTVETASGVMTVHPLGATTIEECMGAAAEGETDEQIIQAFVKEYGSVVFVEPPKNGFGLVQPWSGMTEREPLVQLSS